MLQDTPPAFALHTLTKSVNPNSPANFWLVCTLWHSVNLQKKQGPKAPWLITHNSLATWWLFYANPDPM